MARVVAFVDGFNMYHALQGNTSDSRPSKYRKYKWLDYMTLAR